MATLNNNTLASIQLNQVIEQLEQLLFCDLVMTYNDYADAMSYERIYDNDAENINTLFDTPYNTAQAVIYGDYSPNDDYVMLDGYANAVSFSYQLTQDENCPIDIEELAQWIVDNELFNDYDIEVTTLDDMLASVEDSITDDIGMLYKLCDYLAITYNDSSDTENLIGDCMYKLDGNVTDEIQGIYEKLVDVTNHLNINY